MVLFQNCVRQSCSPTKMATTVQLRCYWKQLWSRWAITGSWEPLLLFRQKRENTSCQSCHWFRVVPAPNQSDPKPFRPQSIRPQFFIIIIIVFICLFFFFRYIIYFRFCNICVWREVTLRKEIKNWQQYYLYFNEITVMSSMGPKKKDCWFPLTLPGSVLSCLVNWFYWHF